MKKILLVATLALSFSACRQAGAPAPAPAVVAEEKPAKAGNTMGDGNAMGGVAPAAPAPAAPAEEDAGKARSAEPLSAPKPAEPLSGH